MTVTVNVKVKEEDLGEEERMLPRMLLRVRDKENLCSLGKYF